MPVYANDTVLLGHRFNANFIPKDTVVLDARGDGVFSGDEELPRGMYLVYLSEETFFDLLINDDQFFSFENDPPDFIRNMRVKDSKENEAFYRYQVYLGESRDKAMSLQEAISNAANASDSIAKRKELDELNTTVQAYIAEQIDNNRDNFFGVFLKALQEVRVPDSPLDENGKPINPAWQYKYYKTHYFDNFNLSDVRLLRTPFYEQKVMTYIDKVAYQHPDSLIKECDMLIGASRADPVIFRYMLITLFNHFAKSQIMGMDKVYIYLADKYYIPEADWSDPEFIEKLKDRVKKAKPTLIGVKATDIQLVRIDDDHFIHAEDDEELKKNPYVGEFFQLYDILADYLILVFWEADCGHCKVQIPELYEVYKRLKDKGVEVVAVSTLGGEEGKVKWVNFVNEKGLYGWVNAWNPYDFSYKQIYDIPSTPQLFIMDKDMRIIAKRIAPDQAEKIIESLMEKDKDRTEDGK